MLSGPQIWPTYVSQYFSFQLCLLRVANDSKTQILHFGNMCISNYPLSRSSFSSKL